jgi:Transposase DDE domain/Transposase domain (DUF772)
MTVGVTPSQADLLKGTAAFCDGRVSEGSIWSVLHRECHRLFPDELFADLFADTGRRSVPPMIVAVVMVLQRLLGLSDREAVDAFCFDARWKYACGGLDFDYPGFVHTVLVDMRARLAASARPRRIFEVTVEAAHAAGLVGAKRVLDSTPLYDAVATMDTITLIRSAMRWLLNAADEILEAELRGLITSGDDYATSSKPHIDWDDDEARGELIDSRAKDAFACLAALDGRELPAEVADAAVLLARIVGQDLQADDDGCFRIARKVAKDRVISVVDPDARHGHKTSARGFDGYKGHAAADPDSEIITDTVVTPGNAGDASVAEELIDDLLQRDDPQPAEPDADADADPAEDADADPAQDAEDADAGPAVYGDAAYGTGEFLGRLEDAGIDAKCKTQPPTAPGGRFTKADFYIDPEASEVTCPAGEVADIRWANNGGGTAHFGDHCANCPLAPECTTSSAGRSIHLGPHEDVLARARARQAEPDWTEDYRATRPKIERKLGHLMRRKHGGRRARVRGKAKVDADFNLLAAAANVARLAVLGLRFSTTHGWTAAT